MTTFHCLWTRQLLRVCSYTASNAESDLTNSVFFFFLEVSCLCCHSIYLPFSTMCTGYFYSFQYARAQSEPFSKPPAVDGQSGPKIHPYSSRASQTWDTSHAGPNTRRGALSFRVIKDVSKVFGSISSRLVTYIVLAGIMAKSSDLLLRDLTDVILVSLTERVVHIT
jgi:hypothetical protein